MRAKRFTAIFFVGVLAVFVCLVFSGLFINAAEKLTTESKAVNINWEELYPFEESAGHALKPKTSLFTYIKDKVDKYTTERMVGHTEVLETARTYEELIGWNMAAVNDYNPVIKLHDGHLAGLAASRDVSENAEAVKELDSFCRELGIEYIYINLPKKICAYDDKEISGVLDYSNQNADRLLDAIGKAGVKNYDLRKKLHAEGMNHHEAFFRTDHHWKPETGLWASKHILQILRDDFGWDVDPEILNPDRFEHKIYRECFLGSHGAKFTLARTKPDDVTILYPKFQTLLHFQPLDIGINVSGDFSVTYNMELVKDGRASYWAYNYAGHQLSKIHNLLSSNHKKVLMIDDSMAYVLNPFIALGIEHIEEMDLRLFTGSVKSYIKSSMPDMVITAYNSGIPGSTRASKYPVNKFYDFR